jgi:hypothetical protein
MPAVGDYTHALQCPGADAELSAVNGTKYCARPMTWPPQPSSQGRSMTLLRARGAKMGQAFPFSQWRFFSGVSIA